MKTVIITGASRGIGKAIALNFAKNNWNTIIISKNSDLNNIKNEILKYGNNCDAFNLDVSNYNEVKDFFIKINEKYSHIDCLINNAGISYIGLLNKMEITEWENIISTNLTSVFNFCKFTIPIMLKKHSGKIINISSVWGEVGASCEVAYSASKGGINAFTKALAKELAPSNIQVNAISCGIIETDMNNFLNEIDKQIILDEIPAGRMGKVEEVAKFTYLVATSPQYLTGQILRLDGGWV